MSYSRWSNSCWYTYSNAYLIDNEPTLCIQCDTNFSLSDLKSNKESILQKFRDERFDRNPENYHGEGTAPSDRYTEDEILELSKIIDDFILDHENQSPK